MIISMTGYGKGVVQKNDVIIEVELKSLNSRFLELTIKLPKSLLQKEFLLREKVKTLIKRGKVTLSISFKKFGVESRGVFIDQKGLTEAVDLLKDIKNAASVKEPVSMDQILTLQHMYFTDAAIDPEEEFELIEKALILAVDEMNNMKKREGEELFKDLLLRADIIENAINQIEEKVKPEIKDYFQKLKERAAELFSDLEANQDRLNTELALLTEKYDITEECVRLRSHLKMYRSILNDPDEAGRKLNFLCQEMNREANTINSKSISLQITYIGIQIKEELEKIREQIQNIE